MACIRSPNPSCELRSITGGAELIPSSFSTENLQLPMIHPQHDSESKPLPSWGNDFMEGVVRKNATLQGRRIGGFSYPTPVPLKQELD